MTRASRRPAAAPFRALLVVMLLTGFGLWQAWQCSEGMAASPIAGMPLTTMSAMQALPDDGTGSVIVREPDTDHGMPGGMAGLCITVLASIAVGLLLIVFSPQQLGLLQRLIMAMVRPVTFAHPGPLLTQLCVSRT